VPDAIGEPSPSGRSECCSRPQCCPIPSAILLGLEGEFSVLSVQWTKPSAVKAVIEQTAREGRCPACGVLSAAVKDRPLIRVNDLPASGHTLELWWRKRRLLCRARLSPLRSSPRPRERCGHALAPPSGCEPRSCR
jgi:hypothetical protein